MLYAISHLFFSLVPQTGHVKWVRYLLRDRRRTFDVPSSRTSGAQCTLSECLFFFGIPSFHFGGPGRYLVFQFLEAATPSIPSWVPRNCVKNGCRGRLSRRRSTSFALFSRPVLSHLVFCLFVCLFVGLFVCLFVCFFLRTGSCGCPRGPLLRTAILPGIHLNPSDFRS